MLCAQRCRVRPTGPSCNVLRVCQRPRTEHASVRHAQCARLRRRVRPAGLNCNVLRVCQRPRTGHASVQFAQHARHRRRALLSRTLWTRSCKTVLTSTGTGCRKITCSVSDSACRVAAALETSTCIPSDQVDAYTAHLFDYIEDEQPAAVPLRVTKVRRSRLFVVQVLMRSSQRPVPLPRFEDI